LHLYNLGKINRTFFNIQNTRIVNFITNIKQKIGYYILRKNIKNSKRKKAFFNFDSAKTVGIIFDASHQDSYLIAKSFMANLDKKNIKVEAVGYVKTKEAISYFPHHEGIFFFSIKEANWYFKPSYQEIIEYSKKSFDILIDLSMSDLLQIKFIIGLSNARLKIGRGAENQEFYDIIINVDQNKSLKEFIDLINHYMSVLKNSK